MKCECGNCKPSVVIGIEGGVVQGASASIAINIVIIDYDEAEMEDIPQSDGSYAEGSMYNANPDVDPEWVASIMKLYRGEMETP